MADAVGHAKRKRSKVACEPCRERKRKCNGANPCTTCNDWGYDCYYGVLPQRKSYDMMQRSTPGVISSNPISLTSSRSEGQTNLPPDSPNHVRSLEANSGAAFVRKMGLNMDPENAPKLNLFGWNIGTRQSLCDIGPCASLPIVDIISEKDMKDLANVYFAKVDPCYGFIDRHAFYERLEARWRGPISNNIYDSVLSGVAALGSLFSQRKITITELSLVESACSRLDLNQVSEAPSVDLVTGWALRVIYMRITSSPHSTWIASSTLMHLIEASGLHLELPSDTVLPHSTPCDPDIRRRLVGVSQHLNMWTSFDLGLSRVSFRSSLPFPPSQKAGDYTTELLNLLPISASLDPGNTEGDRAIESSLPNILDGVHSQPPSILAQCNLVLCVLRRLGKLSFNIPPTLTEQILTLLKHGLNSARSLVQDCCPWHHVANVPFHTICILLVMDTRSSLAILPDAMQTLELVASIYDTDAMRQAYSTACLLVLLYQQRRGEDMKIFSNVLYMHDLQEDIETLPQQLHSSSGEFAWLEGLVADIPSLQKADVDRFLYANMATPPLGMDLLSHMAPN